MKFQQIISALNRIIQVLISLEYTLFNIIPKSLVTLQFLKFLIIQIKAYIQGFQMRYQSFLGHWYPNSYSWFSDSMYILFVLITTVIVLPPSLGSARIRLGLARIFEQKARLGSCNFFKKLVLKKMAKTSLFGDFSKTSLAKHFFCQKDQFFFSTIALEGHF